MNIGIVEDDLLQRTALRNWLEDAGHQCRCFNSGDEFELQARPGEYQVLLFDWGLPGISGIELLSWLRKQQQDTTPVIFITSHDAEEDIVLALSRGADDYLVKPARKQELLARIEALARRVTSLKSPLQNFGNICVDTRLQTITLNGEVVELTQKEYTLASFLLENTGKLLSRNELLESVWGHATEVQTRTVDTHISRLRKKLNLTRDYGWHLGAVYQYGYRLDRVNEQVTPRVPNEEEAVTS